jgi:riboflavin synthase
MFTGLIREIADVKSFKNNILTLNSNLHPKLGDSIATNGVCLTVIATNAYNFSVEVSTETKAIIPSQKFQNQVHIEPAMMLNDRFEGHIVQGHIDTIGEVISIQSKSNGVDIIIKVPPSKIAYIIPKGSITIDGISLTINDVYNDSFRLTIIPHTMQNTLIKTYKIGTKVNIETDLFARYIDHILTHRQNTKQYMGWDEIDAMSMSY